MKKDPRTDVSTTSSAYKTMQPRWGKIDALLGGTETMRASGKDFLPQHAAESDEAYNERLMRCTLKNAFLQTLESMVGRAFGEKVVEENVPADVSSLLEDVDLQGNDVGVFSRQVFRAGLAKAMAHVLVEHPPKVPGAETLADDRATGARPYWCYITPENLIFASSSVVNGQEKLTHVRIREDVVLQDGYSERMVQRIRVLEPGVGRVFEMQEVGAKKEPQWVLVQEY